MNKNNILCLQESWKMSFNKSKLKQLLSMPWEEPRCSWQRGAIPCWSLKKSIYKTSMVFNKIICKFHQHKMIKYQMKSYRVSEKWICKSITLKEWICSSSLSSLIIQEPFTHLHLMFYKFSLDKYIQWSFSNLKEQCLKEIW